MTARSKAVLADAAAEKAHSDAIAARAKAQSYAPDLQLKGDGAHQTITFKSITRRTWSISVVCHIDVSYYVSYRSSCTICIRSSSTAGNGRDG